MKSFVSILTFLFLLNISNAQNMNPRGVRLDAPINGQLLSGLIDPKDNKLITKNVVILGDDGTVYSADAVSISKDGKSFILRGNPLIVHAGKRIFSDKKNSWCKIDKEGQMLFSGGFQIEMLFKNKAKQNQ